MRRYLTTPSLTAPSLLLPLCSLTLLCIGTCAHGDGIIADKVYNPYVQPLEKEIEWRNIFADKDPFNQDDLWLTRLGYGQALAENWAAEAYVIGERVESGSIDVEGVELEIKQQLTQQGEYLLDWGALYELEYEKQNDNWEATATLLTAYQWRQWTFTGNLAILYEWGNSSEELETRFSLQSTYRWRPAIMPALEFYAGQNSRAIGPVLLGNLSLERGRKLLWEVGYLFDTDSKGADRIGKAHIEYEFW